MVILLLSHTCLSLLTPMLPVTAEANLPCMINMCLSKDLNLIPRKQKVIKLLQFLATALA